MSKWQNNQIQFPRLISELQAAGAFTSEVLESLCESMDLEREEIFELVSRADRVWEGEVNKLLTE